MVYCDGGCFLSRFTVTVPIVCTHRRGDDVTSELEPPEELQLDDNTRLRTKSDDVAGTRNEVIVQVEAKNEKEAKIEVLDMVKRFISLLGLQTNIGLLVLASETTATTETSVTVERKGSEIKVGIDESAVHVSDALHLKLLPDPRRVTQAYEDSKRIYLDNDSFDMLLELYSISWHELSPRSRFVTLVTILEGLAPKQKGIPEAKEIVREVLKFLKTMESSDLDEAFLDQLQSFRSKLGELKRESIMDTLRTLASEVEIKDLDTVKFVEEVYSLRSDLVHSKRPVTDEEIGKRVDTLREVVRMLLTSRVQNFLDKAHESSS